MNDKDKYNDDRQYFANNNQLLFMNAPTNMC